MLIEDDLDIVDLEELSEAHIDNIDEVLPDDPGLLNKRHYFINEIVEDKLRRYIWTNCTDVAIRDSIMIHAPELIKQIIRKQNLHMIYPGQEESAFGDLVQTAWVQVERTLYKFRAKPHCRNCYNPDRPISSALYIPAESEYGIITFEQLFDPKYNSPNSKKLIICNKKNRAKCPYCGACLSACPDVEPKQGTFGGSKTVLFRGNSKVFNMWCLTPDSLLFSDKGIIEIGDVGAGDLGDCNIGVFGPEGLHEATKYVKFKRRKTIKLITKFGYNLEATLKHYLPVLRNGIVSKIAVGSLKVGDLLGLQYNQQCFGSNNEIDFKQQKQYKTNWSPPTLWTEELAYIVGLMVSEGSVSRDYAGVCNSDKEVEERLINNHLGLIFKRITPVYVECRTKSFREFVGWLGLRHMVYAWDKTIPQQILQCSRNIIIAFLQGLFDGDGHSNRHNGVTGYTTTSKRLLDQLRVVLLNFGIITKTTIDKRKVSYFKTKGYKSSTRHTAYQLELSATDSKIFYDTIGFRISYKQAKQSHLVDNPYRFVDPDTTRYFQSLLLPKHYKPLLKATGYSKHILLRKRQVTIQTLRQVSNCLGLDDPILRERLSDYCGEGPKTMWVPIASLTPSNSESVDIEVPSSGLFTANGLWSSNSQVSRTVILAFVKKEGRDRKNSAAYKDHLYNTNKVDEDRLKRFFTEASQLCKHNRDHMRCVEALYHVIKNDDRPYDGLIGKLVEHSGLSRIQVNGFIRLLRLRSHEFTDSPLSHESEHDKQFKKQFLCQDEE